MLADDASPIDWIEISGRCFSMGEARVYPEEAPVVERCVETFWISSHEVTVGQFAQFVLETGYRTHAEGGPDRGAAGSWVFDLDAAVSSGNWWRFDPDARWYRSQGETPAPGFSRLPAVHLTLEDARAFARHMNARLPTEAEWELAARGQANGELYAWDEVEDRARMANTWQGLFPLINEAADGYAGLAPVGSYPANSVGLFDMIGNVWEWTDSPYYPSHRPGRSAALRPHGFAPDMPGQPVRVIKGGSFLCAPNYCFRFRPAARQAQDMTQGTSHIGFRLARTTPPSQD